MIRSVLTLSVALAATDVAALTCLATSPAGMFTAAAEAPQEYVVLYGTATFDDTALPPAVTGIGEQTPTAPVLVPGVFDGHVLTPEGFSAPYAGPLTLHAACAGSWCGRMDSPATVLAFALNTPEGPVLVVDPCASKYIENPDSETLATVAACMQGQDCGSDE